MSELKAPGFPRDMLFVLAAAIVLIIAVLSRDNGKNLSDYEAYAIAVGAVAGTLALVALILLKFQAGLLGKVLFSGIDLQHFIAGFLFIWWLVGTCIITFKAPFTVTSNGYFSAWVGLFASAMALGASADMAKKAAQGTILCLLMAAVVVVLAIAILHDTEVERDNMHDESIFGLVSACFTIVCCLLMLLLPSKLPPIVTKIFAILLVLLWIATAGVLTFREPFVITGNGYFGSWAGLIFACMLFSEVIMGGGGQTAHDAETGNAKAGQQGNS
mmetsp:Transcript_27076/g.64316  ORF Transcript_27076/g.64316 Transcript_27076/m.64316 type:complete len:273 (-) Transcript_27076:259-1077(-)